MPLIDSFKAGDTEPELTHTIEGLAQDASNINDVILYMSPEDQDGLQINNSVDSFSSEGGGDDVSIEYQLSSAETSISERHQVEFVVEYTDNLHETFPKSGFWSIQVSEPLERDGDPIEIQTDHDMDRLGVDELGSQSGNGVSVTDNFDFGGNNVSGVGSLGVGSLEVGEEQSDRHWKLAGQEQPASNTNQFQFGGLSVDVEYRLFFISRTGDDVYLRLNGDGDTTGNYFYWDETGTKQTGENEIPLISLDSACFFELQTTITNARYDDRPNRVGVSNSPAPGGPPGPVAGYADAGGRDVTDGISSIEVRSDNAFEGGETTIELWARNY